MSVQPKSRRTERFALFLREIAYVWPYFFQVNWRMRALWPSTQTVLIQSYRPILMNTWGFSFRFGFGSCWVLLFLFILVFGLLGIFLVVCLCMCVCDMHIVGVSVCLSVCICVQVLRHIYRSQRTSLGVASHLPPCLRQMSLEVYDRLAGSWASRDSFVCLQSLWLHIHRTTSGCCRLELRLSRLPNECFIH